MLNIDVFIAWIFQIHWKRLLKVSRYLVENKPKKIKLTELLEYDRTCSKIWTKPESNFCSIIEWNTEKYGNEQNTK